MFQNCGIKEMGQNLGIWGKEQRWNNIVGSGGWGHSAYYVRVNEGSRLSGKAFGGDYGARGYGRCARAGGSWLREC